MKVVLAEVSRESLRATAESMRGMIAVTDAEVILAKAGWFGNKVRRVPLSALTGMRFSPNPHAHLLALEFGGEAGMTLMFRPDAKESLDRVVEVLSAVLDEEARA